MGKDKKPLGVFYIGISSGFYCVKWAMVKKIHRSEKKNAKKFGGYGTILYFCIVLTLKSYVICDLKRLGVYIHKALLDALFLTVEELRKLI